MASLDAKLDFAYRDLTLKMAKELRPKLKAAAKKVLTDFYLDYTWKDGNKYNRIGNLMNSYKDYTDASFWHASKSQVTRAVKTGHSAVLKFSTDYMPYDRHKNASGKSTTIYRKDCVMIYDFDSGYHGGPFTVIGKGFRKWYGERDYTSYSDLNFASDSNKRSRAKREHNKARRGSKFIQTDPPPAKAMEMRLDALFKDSNNFEKIAKQVEAVTVREVIAEIKGSIK